MCAHDGNISITRCFSVWLQLWDGGQRGASQHDAERQEEEEAVGQPLRGDKFTNINRNSTIKKTLIQNEGLNLHMDVIFSQVNCSSVCTACNRVVSGLLISAVIFTLTSLNSRVPNSAATRAYPYREETSTAQLLLIRFHFVGSCRRGLKQNNKKKSIKITHTS